MDNNEAAFGPSEVRLSYWCGNRLWRGYMDPCITWIGHVKLPICDMRMGRVVNDSNNQLHPGTLSLVLPLFASWIQLDYLESNLLAESE